VRTVVVSGRAFSPFFGEYSVRKQWTAAEARGIRRNNGQLPVSRDELPIFALNSQANVDQRQMVSAAERVDLLADCE